MTMNAAEAAKTLQVGDSVKFDFGGTKSTASGYIGVDATRSYYTKGVEALNTDSATGYTYGFLGIGEDGYLASDRADGDRTDGFTMDPGMEITLLEGGTGEEAAKDYVYASQTIYNLEKTEKEEAYDMGDGTMPIRFALNVEPKSYYTVKATLANASDTEKAVVNLYSERRHQIATNVELAAGETKEITFNAAVTDVYFQKSEPKGTYNDTQLNVTVIGENAALAALEVSRIEHSPTMYICGDSTVCDQVGYVPAYPLHNYTGVGQGISAYFRDIMISNQGEGGLSAADAYHFNSAAAQLQAGDYLYVQYGHNHKNDGVAGYVNCLKKYYTAAHDKGAKLLLVGTIDRQMKTQYNSSANTWSSTLSGYSHAAEGYVTALIYGGITAADDYVAAWQSTEGQTAADAYIEELKADGITEAGVTDAAFVDLNAGWIDFLESVTAGNAAIGQNQYSHASFYYTYNNVYDAKDLTHINDYGASQAGYILATEIKKIYEAGIAAGETSAEYVQAMVLEDLYEDYTSNRKTVTPDAVSDETVLAGAAPNSCYPQKFVIEDAPLYTTAIKKIHMKDGVFTTVDVHIVSGMNSYGKVALKVYDKAGTLVGTIWTTDWLDNTSMTAGSNETLHFEESDMTMPEGGKCIAEVYPVSDDTQQYDGEAEAISKRYTAQESDGILITDLVLEKTIAASAERSGNEAVCVVDGDDTTVWTPGGGAAGHVIVDLEDVYTLDKMELYTHDWYGFAYKIEVSEDGTNYSLFYENTEESGVQYTTEIADPKEVISGRYVKITITKPSNGQWIGLADLNIYEYLEKESEIIVDKTALHALIAEVEKLAAADYTKESFEALQTALTAAKAEAAKEDATQETVDTVLFALNTAKTNLVPAAVITPEPTPTPTPQPEPTPQPTPEVKETTITLDAQKVVMGKNEKNVVLKAVVDGAAFAQAVTWSSSKPKVVDVKGGKLTAKKTGKAVITATTADGKTATCTVTVKAAPKKIYLKKNSAKLSKGQTVLIKVKKYSPKSAASYKLTYKSSNKKVAAVSAAGKVTAKKKGTAKITVKTFNGKKAIFKVTVK